MAEVERDAAGYTPNQIKVLKIVIAIMTFAIVAGLVVLVATIVYRASNHKHVAAPAAAAADLHVLFPSTGAIPQGKLPSGSHVVAMTPFGDRLVLAVEDGSGTELLTLDPKTGKIEPLAQLVQSP